MLLISGDTFTNRLPDPVLQQVEHFGDPTITVNDAFKAVTRYWDRITHPAQILSSLPQAVAAMLDPADCGPAFLALPQDIQEVAFDYPAGLLRGADRGPFRGRVRTDRKLAEAAALLKTAKKPILIAGGGVRYSLAENAVGGFAVKRGIPIVETIAGKGGLTHYHPAHAGPIGIIGSTSANALAADADVILAVGTRLMDFTTGSWTAFSPDARFISINAARFDAVKHRALAVVGDALETVTELDAELGDWRVDPAHMARARRCSRNGTLCSTRIRRRPTRPFPTYAQVVGAVNAAAGETGHADLGGRRPAGRSRQGLAGQGAQHLRPRIRLLLHGLRDRGRLGPRDGQCGPGRPRRHADRHGRRRHLHDDELRHLFVGPQRPQDDRRRLRQRRLRRHQPAAAGQGRARLQQSARRLPRREPRARRCTSISPSTPRPWAPPRGIARASPISQAALEWAKANDRTTVLSIASDA